MTTKYTLYSLCQKYDKVEIPIIQRDYAQGRETQNELRSKFVDYLLSSLERNIPIELDFVYGEERTDLGKDGKSTVATFVPIDGQQRLTTLWLLHWFLSVREGRLEELKPILTKFTYETRPTTHDFCSYLISDNFPQNQIPNIDEYIQDCTWFDPEWMNDSSIRGMLRMIRTFISSSSLTNGNICLEQLLSPNDMISFYFVSLKDFGLSEELYIRMNARGKILTSFENFKSELYKDLKDYPRLEEIKDKMEYAWVSNLWCYRKDKVYTTDECFMNFLQFITRMLYFSQAEYRAAKGYEKDFADFKLLRKVYSKYENADFLIFALDNIPFAASINNGPVLWDNHGNKQTIPYILSICIKGGQMNIDQLFVLYSTFVYAYRHKSSMPPLEDTGDNPFCDKLNDYVRAVRNLIVNTNDKSEREHPRIINSIMELSDKEDVYAITRKQGFNLKGLNDSQCEEEFVKSNIVFKHPSAKQLIHKIEDNHCFRGNIRNILSSVFTDKELGIKNFSFQEQNIIDFNEDRLQRIYDKYMCIAKDDFNAVWGDLLNTSLYSHNKSSARLTFDENYSKNPAVISMAARLANSKFETLDDFIDNEEKRFVCKLASKYEDLSFIKDVKVQLKLLYILTVQVMDCKASEFFANGYNFGWLQKETGFTSLFTQGIDGNPWFSEKNPIFQTYNSQFRYNMGLYREHALPCEIVGNRKPQKAWDKLIEWANT